eukprot:EG_transcript_18625
MAEGQRAFGNEKALYNGQRITAKGAGCSTGSPRVGPATVTRVITAHRNASALHIHVTAGSRVDAKGNVACWQALPLKLTPAFHEMIQFFRIILEKIISDTYEILAFLHIVQLVDQSFCH